MKLERCIIFAAFCLLTAACTTPFNLPDVRPTTAIPRSPAATPAATLATSPTASPPTPTPLPWDDAASVMNGLCFEAVSDATGRAFVIRSAAELAAFYDLADHSELCRRPVRREPFDFSGGRVLAGIWSTGVGCTAHHEIVRVARDDVARAYSITLRLVVEGSCAYELVRPFWIALNDMADYDIRLLVR